MEGRWGKGLVKKEIKGRRRRPSPHEGSAGYKSGDLSFFLIGCCHTNCVCISLVTWGLSGLYESYILRMVVKEFLHFDRIEYR